MAKSPAAPKYDELSLDDLEALDLDALTIDELEHVNRPLMALKDRVRTHQVAVNEAMSRAAAKERIERMNDSERQALAQTIKDVGGVEALMELGVVGGES